MDRWLAGVAVVVWVWAAVVLVVAARSRATAARGPRGPGLDILVLARGREDAVEGLVRGLLRLRRAAEGWIQGVSAAGLLPGGESASVLGRLAAAGCEPAGAPGEVLEWLWERCQSRPTLVLCLGPHVDPRELLAAVGRLARGEGAGAVERV
ncbi:MAG: hypothetical protein K6T75_09050 [Acetobacteraceae bacterium]|nr:hypothetical protein [Acetobacteraceae bacterium]